MIYLIIAIVVIIASTVFLTKKEKKGKEKNYGTPYYPSKDDTKEDIKDNKDPKVK